MEFIQIDSNNATAFFFLPFFQYSPKFCVANKYLTLIFLCYFLPHSFCVCVYGWIKFTLKHVAFSIFFEEHNSRLFLGCLFIYLSPLLFFFLLTAPLTRRSISNTKKVFPAITAAVIKCLFPPLFILWKESE